ncbi:MAG: hypothetical protein O7A09_06430 [Proteobacteria bacterium]|nr:hypothetical protein [Pseudomonadota bacterium]
MRGEGLAGLLLAVGLLAAPAVAQPEPAESPGRLPPAEPVLDGPVFWVSQFLVQYREGEGEGERIPLDQILPIEVELGRTATGYVAARPGLPVETLRIPDPSVQARPYHASAVASIDEQVLDAFRRRGLSGVTVEPHERDLDLENERDLRLEGDTFLRLVVSTARVRELRSVGFGDRLPDDWRIDNAVHRRIRDRSPIQPRETEDEDSTELLRRDLLEDYLFRLNRHPGRHVDAALSPAEEGGVSLDYRVNESRPWYVYAEASNAGTEQTFPWQTRLGFVHRQLSNRDDILSLDFLNAGGDDVNAISGAYEAPWFSADRPSWLVSDEEDSPWVSWIPLDYIPWIGSDRLRWRVAGSWSRILALAVDSTDAFESRDWDLSGDFIYNAFQHRNWFVDFSAGARVRDLFVENLVKTQVNPLLVLPQGALRLERVTETSTLLAQIGAEGNVNAISDPALLGRILPDPRWALLLFDFYGSSFLEPIVNRRRWQDPSTPRSSKLAHEAVLAVRGQYAFDYRLVPQAAMVAGGLYSVRGYPQSTAVGDTVVVGTLEYRYHLARSLPIRRKPLRVPVLGSFRVSPQQVYGAADWDLVLSAFVDSGFTVRNDRPKDSTERDQTLFGAGLGAELQLMGHFRFRFNWARALKDTNGEGEPVRAGNDELYFTIGVVY